MFDLFTFSQLRFGKINKQISNTNVFEHAGKFYSIAENHEPQEINIVTLETLHDWDVNGAWNRPFSSHPKVSSLSLQKIFLGFDFTVDSMIFLLRSFLM